MDRFLRRALNAGMGMFVGVLCTGCEVVYGFEDFTGQSSIVACPEQAAPSVKGTKMVQVERQPTECFWMDEHEVTRGQYREFSNSSPSAQTGACTWNTLYIDAECENGSLRITDDDKQPMTCVDQCDAAKYCEWVGKSLCRSDIVFSQDSTRDDWFAACSNAGETVYPYGNAAVEDVCNVLLVGNETTRAVDQGAACSNRAGVTDLVGNVWEWTGGASACKTEAGENDECLARGGSFASQASEARCDAKYNPPRNATRDDLGFRCCAYPVE